MRASFEIDNNGALTWDGVDGISPSWKLRWSRDGKDWGHSVATFYSPREAWDRFKSRRKRYKDWHIRLVRNDGKTIIEHKGVE